MFFIKKKQQHEEEIISTSSFEHFEFRWENFPMAFPFDGKPQCCYSKQALWWWPFAMDLFLSSSKSALQKDYVTEKNVRAQTKKYKN